MSSPIRARNAVLLGATLALVSLLAFPSLLRLWERPGLSLHIEARDVALGPHIEIKGGEGRQLYVDGEAASASDPVSPGLHRIEWKESYRGGHERSVGLAQLVGPLQDAETPACSLAVLVAPSFLQQTAPILQSLVEEQLRGVSQWPVGDFQSITGSSLQWIRWGDEMAFRLLRKQLENEIKGERLGGHLRVSMKVRFENADVLLSISVIPIIIDGALKFRFFVHAKLDLDNRLFQWVANFFDGDDRVSRLIEKEVSREMRNVLNKPPDISLDRGGTLEIEFCDGAQLRFHEAGHVSMPLALRIADMAPAPPLYAQPPARSSAPMQTPLAVELDRNALGVVLHTLWASGVLDWSLAETAIHAFNEHPTVREFLNLRIENARFHLPPTLNVRSGSTGGFTLRAASKLTFRDGKKRSNASLFTEFEIDSNFLREPTNATSGAGPLSLSAIQLTCTTPSGSIHPCYAQIVAQLRANQEHLQQRLGTLLRELLMNLFTQRTISAPGAPAEFRLESTEFHLEGTLLRANLSGTVQNER
ncbi:MAG: hypothetical protein GY811_15260 [Myxococcales bacterium]|nr:hypothetical protein [Myxococcales bacterium]